LLSHGRLGEACLFFGGTAISVLAVEARQYSEMKGRFNDNGNVWLERDDGGLVLFLLVKNGGFLRSLLFLRHTALSRQ